MSVIDAKGIHRALIQDADHYATLAGIPKGALWVALAEIASPQEVKWATIYRQHEAKGIFGLVWTGKYGSVIQRAQALAACLVRNFIDARLRPLEQALEEFEDCSCLIIPDLYLGDTPKEWQRERVTRMLLRHRTAGHRLVVYLASLHEFEKAYGPVAASAFDGCLKLQLDQ